VQPTTSDTYANFKKLAQPLAPQIKSLEELSQQHANVTAYQDFQELDAQSQDVSTKSSQDLRTPFNVIQVLEQQPFKVELPVLVLVALDIQEQIVRLLVFVRWEQMVLSARIKELRLEI